VTPPRKPDKNSAPLPEKKSFRTIFIVVLLLVTFIAYFPVMKETFHLWDDDVYITTNQRVQKGLTADNVAWAFTTNYFGFYYPLTWLSHMADCQLYGLKPAGHYFTSIVIHSLNAALLFILLLLATGSEWRSFFAACLFALHPMNVESVAWLAERKNILAAFFLLLAFIFYTINFRDGGKGRSPRLTFLYYLFFVMGLMSKSSIVVFPLLLLVFDFWPLKRIPLEEIGPGSRSMWKLVMEKVPLFAISAVSGIVTIIAQKKINTIPSLDYISLPKRIGEALLGLGFYLEKLFVPVNLCAFYPHHKGNYPLILPAAMFVVIAVISAAAFVQRKKNPVLIAGWLFFLVSLLPVIGILQVGAQAYADRYPYFGYWGLFCIFAFGIGWEKIAGEKPSMKTMLAGGAAALFVVLFVLTRMQISVWKDDESLFGNIIKVSPKSTTGYFQLGNTFLAKEDPGRALELFKQAHELDRENPDIISNIGIAYMRLGDNARAVEYFDLLLKMRPNLAMAYFNKACALIGMKKGKEAMENLDIARDKGFDPERIAETMAGAQKAVAAAFLDEGRKSAEAKNWIDAEASFRKALEILPGKADAWSYLGFILQSKGDAAEAERAYRRAIELDGAQDAAIYNLALMALQRRDQDEARKGLAELQRLGSNYAPPLKSSLEKAFPSK